MSAPTVLADVVDDSLCGCGRPLSSHYADMGRMRGPNCPDFHTQCDRTCKHPTLRARPATGTPVRLAKRVGGYGRNRYPEPEPEVPTHLREEPLPADMDEQPAPPPAPVPETPAAASSRVAAGPAAVGDGAPAAAPAAPRRNTPRPAASVALVEPAVVGEDGADEEVAVAVGALAAATNLRTRLTELAQELLARRKRVGISQGALARASALPQSVVSAVENGTRRLTPDTLYALASALGFDVDIQLVDHSAPAASAAPAVDVEAVRALATDMYPTWLCPKCNGRRYDRTPCCGRKLQPVWVAILPREDNDRG